MKRLIWLGLARRDLAEITRWIAQDSPQVAIRLVERVRTTAERLRDVNLGRPTTRAGVQSWPVKGLPYMLFFRRTDEAIEIVRVLHGARDPGRLGL